MIFEVLAFLLTVLTIFKIAWFGIVFLTLAIQDWRGKL